MSGIEELLQELKAIGAADTVAFPYEDCRKLQQIDERVSAVVPDLDVYLSELAGYRSWGKRILTWSDEKIEEVHRSVGQSFFDRFPIYGELSSHITPTSVPALHATLDRAERTRAALRELLSHLQRERATATT
ncbi:MAG TPA: hypothetical protein VGQ76_20150 [Thermoanaerobaculia bacterium]|jgi:hypothetical protein|nr:hypothetical protein [Thermoanaerobaculia bacterium]